MLEIDPKTGKFKLSHRVLVEKPADYVEPQQRRRERGERPERGERRDRGERRNDRGERRPRPERSERRERNDEYQASAENNEPKDFTDELDKMDF